MCITNVTEKCMDLATVITIETLMCVRLYKPAVSPFSRSRKGLRTVPESPEIMTPTHCQ